MTTESSVTGHKEKTLEARLTTEDIEKVAVLCSDASELLRSESFLHGIKNREWINTNGFEQILGIYKKLIRELSPYASVSTAVTRIISLLKESYQNVAGKEYNHSESRRERMYVRGAIEEGNDDGFGGQIFESVPANRLELADLDVIPSEDLQGGWDVK